MIDFLNKIGVRHILSKVETLFSAKNELKRAKERVYTTACTDGNTYTLTIEGVTELYAGMELTIKPNMSSKNRFPTFNLNGLGDKYFVQTHAKAQTGSTSYGTIAGWITADKPIKVRYDGNYWVVVDHPLPDASTLQGEVAVEHGGTGAKDAATARANLGITPANIGAAASSHKHEPSDLNSAVPVDNGGTGATDAATARSNLGITPENIGAAKSSHNQAASTITAGTLGGQVVANSTAVSTIGTAQVRNIKAGTADLTAGSSSLATGEIYLKYE